MGFKQKIFFFSLLIFLSSSFLGLLFWGTRADAVPSYARQTGLACSSCHTTPPELTPLGRQFKLNGYTLTGLKTITSKPGHQNAPLSLLTELPLSAQFTISNTNTERPQPGTQNGSFELPQSASLFLAGAMGDHVGSFIQVTYSGQADHFSWDNTDIRYAEDTKFLGKDLVYGIDFNNNPTVEDLWNDTPAWGFPWVSPDSAPTPIAAPVIDGGLAQDVAGIGGYTMFDQHLYAAGFIYRSAHLGGAQPNPGTGFGTNIQGLAPYWRVAWQQTRGNNYLEVGTYGMHLASTPGSVVGPRDYFTDLGADFQWERTVPWKSRNDLLTVHGDYVHESSDLLGTLAATGAAFASHDLNFEHLDAVYHLGNRYSFDVGPFAVTGTADPTLYASAPVSGSATGNPRADGYILNMSYWPLQNIQLGVEYTGYLKFNGLGVNYDGSGRNASANNSIYLVAWFVF
ncbi:MAG: hypothetical protein ACRD3T_05250 [Terriglobia bacterium]